MSLFDELLQYESQPSQTSRVKPVSAPPKVGAKKPAAPKTPDVHKHPAASGSTVQKTNFVEYGTEGCPEHYKDRYISQDEVLVEIPRDYSAIAEAIVIGEALGSPRSKKPWRPR